MTERRSYTYRCTGCGSVYSWVPETEDEKPRQCGRRIKKSETKPEGEPCPGRGERIHG